MSYRLVNFQEIKSDTFPQYAEFEISDSIADFEDAFGLSLERNSTVDYVVTQDSQKENTFALPNASDLGQLGALLPNYENRHLKKLFMTLKYGIR